MSESKINICDKCSSKESKKKSSESKDTKEYPCEKCAIVFRTKPLLKKHMIKCYGSFVSPYDGKKFNVFSSLMDIRENYLECYNDGGDDIESFFINLEKFFLGDIDK